MGLFDKITAKNFNAYAMKHYDDPQCEDMEDFFEDIRRFRYLKRLLHRYHDLGELRERLMLNHIICLFNVFGFEDLHENVKLQDQRERTLVINQNYVIISRVYRWFMDVRCVN